MKALHPEIIDRLTTLANDITARVSACESSVSIVEIKVVKLSSDFNDNVANTMKIATDIAAITFAQTNLNATWPTPQAVGSKSVGVASITPPTVDDIAVKLDSRNDKRLNVIVFGLSPKAGTDDRDIFLDMIDRELNVQPHNTKVSLLGKGTSNKSPPLLVSLLSMADKSTLLYNAKKLRISSCDDAKKNVFIIADLTHL